MIYGISSNVIAQAVNVFIQLAGVPILLKCWGIHYYGEWLVLYTIPSYIEISDFGLGTSATAEMSILKEAGDSEKVKSVLRNAFWFILLIGGVPFALLYLSGWIIPWHHVLGFENIQIQEFELAFLFLLIYVYLSLFLTLPLGFYRVQKNYHRERYISIFFKILEFGGLIGVVVAGYGAAIAAAVFVCIKAIYFLVVVFDLRRKYAEFDLGPIGFDHKKIKHLFKPSLSLMVIYLGQSILTQGLTTTIGVALGSVQVVIFNTTRTLVNFSKQIVSIINLSFISEFSYAYGAMKYDLLQSLYVKGQRMNILVSFISLAFLVVFGHIVLRIWTDGQVYVLQPFYLLMIIATFINSWWNGSLVFLISMNKQYKAGVYFLVISLITLALSAFVVDYGGLSSVAGMLIAFELVMCTIIFLLCSSIVRVPVLSWLRIGSKTQNVNSGPPVLR